MSRTEHPTSPVAPQSVLLLALRSVGGFGSLCASRSLGLRRERHGAVYSLGSRGTFAVFRETVSSAPKGAPAVVLVVGFRLRVAGRSRLAHRVFQRCCILTTPFWSGFTGFHVKLWMVDPQTKGYLGIYDWYGRDPAQTYLSALLPVLRFVSVRGSVWYEIHETDFEQFLRDRRLLAPPSTASRSPESDP